jgi:hypothetical protein
VGSVPVYFHINKLRGLSPSDRSLTTLVPIFEVRGVSRGQRGATLRPYSRFPRSEPLLFLPSSSSVVLTRLSGPRSRPTTSQVTWYLLTYLLCDLSTQANYTDRATTACWRSLCHLLWIEGATWSAPEIEPGTSGSVARNSDH